jgi:hypothetical protein
MTFELKVTLCHFEECNDEKALIWLYEKSCISSLKFHMRLTNILSADYADFTNYLRNRFD